MSAFDDEDDAPVASPSTGGAIMSLFSSYYDIASDTEDAPEAEYKTSMDLIDTVHFDTNAFVRDLLETSSIETLVSKDRRMVQEVKAIDSDLQMLVYENYAKFISATDTIKRMKTNVEAMDEDMGSVLDRMSRISSSSLELDGLLEASRNKVDKLVRIKRLLERLQFLSQLPESLAKMIHNEEYKDAIVLYKKTISILKNHSDMLSFKHIIERTELMMIDLRKSVLHFLNDSSLECSKLTHYIAILRLMEAPRDQVASKFIGAHTERSALVNTELRKYIASTSTHDPTSVMRMHQTLIVGLIESTKGLQELFSGGGSIVEAAHALSSLVELISSVCAEYSVCVCQAMSSFFARFESNLRIALLSGPSTGEDKQGDNPFDEPANPFEGSGVHAEEAARNAQLSSAELDDERHRWLTLARQSVLDWQYLDTALANCIPLLLGSDSIEAQHLSSTEVEAIRDKAAQSKVSKTYSASIAAVLDAHRTATTDLYLDQFMSSFHDYVGEISRLCNPRTSTEDSHAEESLRSVLAINSAESKERLEALVGQFYYSFGDACANGKLIFDVVCVTEGGSSSQDASSAVGEFLDGIVRRFVILNGPLCCTQDYASLLEIYDEEECDEKQVSERDAGGLKWTVERCTALASSVVLKKIATGLIRRVSVVLVQQEMTGRFNSDSQMQSLCVKKLADTSYRCLVRFVDNVSSVLSERLRLALQQLCVQVDGAPAKKITVSPEVINIALELDVYTVACCVVLSESPYPLRLFSVERELHKRNANRKGQGNRTGVQRDINRLFATKVDVFEADQITLSLESLLKLPIKSLLKAALETVRELTLSATEHYIVEANLHFLRQTVAVLLQSEGVSEVEELGEQALNAASSRCTDPDIPEGLSILKTVTDALAALANQPTLFQR